MPWRAACWRLLQLPAAVVVDVELGDQPRAAPGRQRRVAEPGAQRPDIVCACEDLSEVPCEGLGLVLVLAASARGRAGGVGGPFFVARGPGPWAQLGKQKHEICTCLETDNLVMFLKARKAHIEIRFV